MMIEVIIKEYLDEKMDVPVYLEHPRNAPSSYIIFEKTSGRKTNHLVSSMFAFQSYAPSLYEAAMLNEKVKEAVEYLIEIDAVSGVKLNSDYNFTDTDFKAYRYQAVFDINHY